MLLNNILFYLYYLNKYFKNIKYTKYISVKSVHFTDKNIVFVVKL